MSLTALERPAAGEAAGALVLFHGRGADEHDLYPLLDYLDPERRLDGYTPRAPLSLPPGGAHWYIVERVGYPHRETFDAAFALIEEWLGELVFPPERVFLGGFSQGAVMAYALGLGRGRPRPASIAALKSSTGDLVSDSIFRFMCGQPAKPYPRAITSWASLRTKSSGAWGFGCSARTRSIASDSPRQ